MDEEVNRRARFGNGMETAARMRAGGRARGRAEEYVEVCAPFEAAMTVVYVLAGRVDEAWFDRSRRWMRTTACVAIAALAHGVYWTIGVLVTSWMFHLVAAWTRGTTWSAGRRTAVCVASASAALAAGERLELAGVGGARGIMGSSGFMSRTTFNAHRAFRYDVLRLISFGVDCVEDAATPTVGRAVNGKLDYRRLGEIARERVGVASEP